LDPFGLASGTGTVREFSRRAHFDYVLPFIITSDLALPLWLAELGARYYSF